MMRRRAAGWARGGTLGAAALAWALTGGAWAAAGDDDPCVERTDGPVRVLFEPTLAFVDAGGCIVLTPAWSPFELAVTTDGHLLYDVVVAPAGLPDPTSRGDYDGFVVWLATPDLSLVERLGAITVGEALSARVHWNKFLVVVTLERADAAAAGWRGPIALAVRSPSAEMQPLVSHSIFNRPEF